MSKLIEQTTVD